MNVMGPGEVVFEMAFAKARGYWEVIFSYSLEVLDVVSLYVHLYFRILFVGSYIEITII